MKNAAGYHPGRVTPSSTDGAPFKWKKCFKRPAFIPWPFGYHRFCNALTFLLFTPKIQILLNLSGSVEASTGSCELGHR